MTAIFCPLPGASSDLDLSRFAPPLDILDSITATAHAARHDSRKLDAIRKDAEDHPEKFRKAVRLDAEMPGDLGTLALGTTYRSKNIIEQAVAPQNAMRLFQPFAEVPPGARDFTVVYERGVGEATIHRTGQLNVSPVGVGAFEDKFPVLYLWTAYEIPFHDEQSQSFQAQNIGLAIATEARLQARAAQTLAQTANQIYWYGDTNSGAPGIITYPLLAKKVIPSTTVPFDGTGSPTDVVAELRAAANYARSVSRGRMFCNKIAMTPRLESYLMVGSRLGSVNDTTAGRFLLDGLKNQIKGGFEVAHELMDLNGTSRRDGILFYNDDPEATAIVPVQGITFLPPVLLGIKKVVYAYMILGGGIMRTPGHNLLLDVYAPAS